MNAFNNTRSTDSSLGLQNSTKSYCTNTGYIGNSISRVYMKEEGGGLVRENPLGNIFSFPYRTRTFLTHLIFKNTRVIKRAHLVFFVHIYFFFIDFEVWELRWDRMWVVIWKINMRYYIRRRILSKYIYVRMSWNY